MAFSYDQKHSLTVDSITNDETLDTPSTKKAKTRERRTYADYHYGTKLKPIGNFETYFILKAKCRELELEEEKEIQPLLDALDEEQDKLELELTRTLNELNRTYDADVVKIQHYCLNKLHPLRDKEISRLERNLREAFNNLQKTHD